MNLALASAPVGEDSTAVDDQLARPADAGLRGAGLVETGVVGQLCKFQRQFRRGPIHIKSQLRADVGDVGIAGCVRPEDFQQTLHELRSFQPCFFEGSGGRVGAG